MCRTNRLALALDGVTSIIQPDDDVYYRELDAQYRAVRRYLPTLVEHIQFDANADGRPVVAAVDWLRDNMTAKKPNGAAPLKVIGRAWRRHVLCDDGTVDFHAYTFCALDELQIALKRRDVFVARSWRYADPLAGLLEGAEWEASRPIICRTLGLSADAGPTLARHPPNWTAPIVPWRRGFQTIRRYASMWLATRAS
jgi:hypothetical protein